MRRAPQAGQRVWVRHPIPLQKKTSCSVSSSDIGESEDLLTEEELDLVQGYMDQPFHDWGSQR